MKQQDLIIIGGGIMGLMTAYYASPFVRNIVVLEKSTIGNKDSASFSFTRSIRSDYLDPEYSRLAYESQQLWKQLQEKIDKQFLFSCGCMNIVKKTVTPNFSTTYAQLAYNNEVSINLLTKKFSKSALKKTFPQFSADMACLDIQAGFLYQPVINEFILKTLKERGVTIIENIALEKIEEKDNVTITTNKGIFITKKLVITTALGTNIVLQKIQGNTLQFPIYPDKPQECKYVYIPKRLQKMFSPKNFPVFAYLDVGIYGHPIFDAKKQCIKIGFYNPPDVQKKMNKTIYSIDTFINECLPILKNAKRELVKDADQCSYDLVKDDNFILGNLPGYKNIIVGCGWRGTGYKYAPLIGKNLMQLSIQGGSVYNIQRFAPERFVI
ncbi:MAG TPA: FAD-dependent oxidoreductase [Candidatus Eisenbacteria bacterium]|nr:FAD-dependent oxidoreductase [Candidatus Eisenbacteria bacterium]